MLLNENLEQGTVYYTNYQTAGRGQMENKWQSNDGQNVLMSIYLKPVFLNADEQSYLNMIVSLAVKDAAQQLVQPNVYIKWPNDIIAENLKLGGILVENVLQKNKVKYCIAGIGLNVNQTDFGILNATSLKLLTGQIYQPLEVIEIICKALEKYYLWLNQKQFEKILEAYTVNLYAKDVERIFKIENKTVKGKIMGVNKNGRLYVMINEEIKSFANKEIELIY